MALAVDHRTDAGAMSNTVVWYPIHDHPPTYRQLQVRFRILVFRPFIGEILSGRVSCCTKQGIKISLDFFENASIPKELLQSPSVL